MLQNIHILHPHFCYTDNNDIARRKKYAGYPVHRSFLLTFLQSHGHRPSCGLGHREADRVAAFCSGASHAGADAGLRRGASAAGPTGHGCHCMGHTESLRLSTTACQKLAGCNDDKYEFCFIFISKLFISSSKSGVMM